ncbi:hypothetical protein BWK69_00995 [Candidatus Parcubacteria bacterium A4]|nr:MAG: hypothetical protein BWK69_00995 [Candidatus Parcubacteria bacterium A4]
MKIPQHLLQFENKKALFIVTGEKVVEFYIAGDGAISKEKEFEIIFPEHLKTDGFFGRKGGGGVGTGSLEEMPKEKVRQDFLKEYKVSIKEIFSKNKINHIYLFSPSEVIGIVEKNLPAGEGKKILGRFKGNFHNQTPIQLLEKIKADIKGKEVEILKPEEEKIINSSRI